jgi:hypothetical protein
MSIRYGDIDEPDRKTIIANDVVVDVIENDDGSVYVEFYAYGFGEHVRVSDTHGLENRHPSLRLMTHHDQKEKDASSIHAGG